uniref:Pre-mRNA 3'-end-processing factor FIP1 n=1 Tax=Poecilia reticulata TaxID=8081 RepID=A0A3P9P9N3_POERE
LNMSGEEADKTATTDASAGDEEEEWLYGDALWFLCSSDNEALSSNYLSVLKVKLLSGSVVNLKRGKTSFTSFLSVKTAFKMLFLFPVTTKVKGVDLDAPGSINGVPVLEVDMESFEEKPWRKPGADLSDYFNYGFNEDTWKAYCEKQKRLRMGLEVSTIGSVTSKISVQQGRTGNEKDVSSLVVHTSKTDFTSPVSLKTSGTIDVIGGQTATISRVEGRRRHNLEGNNIQVISEHSTSEAEPAAAKIPTFFPPGPLPPNIPPPPFLPPPPNVSTAPPLIPPPRLPITVPPPGFHPPTSGPPPSLIPPMDSHPGGYDGRSVPPYPFPQGAYPPPLTGGVPPPWPPMVDNSKPWDYYSRREDKRDKERDRPRERTHEREREREHSPSTMSYTRSEGQIQQWCVFFWRTTCGVGGLHCHVIILAQALDGDKCLIVTVI